MKRKTFLFIAGLVASLSLEPLVASAAPPPSRSEMASGPYSRMHMLLEKTFLKVDVLTVDVRFGKGIHSQIASLAKGKQYSDALGKQIANVAIKANDAMVELKYVRDVSLSQWMDNVKENLEQARKAGLISAAVEKRVGAGLPNWFKPISDRGYKEGDRLIYRVRANSLRTIVIGRDGKTLLDFTDKDKDAPGVVMASYFAPGSDFRKPLLKSLFK